MKRLLATILMLGGMVTLVANETPVLNVQQSPQGTIEIHFEGTADHYYILHRSLTLADRGDAIDMVLGTTGPMLVKDRLRAVPDEVFYRVHQVPNTESLDTDGDGLPDYKELRPSLFLPDKPSDNALNPIKNIHRREGSYILSQAQFDDYSVRLPPQGQVFTSGLTGDRVIKFVGLPFYDPAPAILFMHSGRHQGHLSFVQELKKTHDFDETAILRGEMTWIPDDDEFGPGWYTFNAQPGDAPSFEHIRFLYHMLTKNMPLVDGNLAYRPLDASLIVYRRDQHLFKREGIPIWLDEDRPGFNDYVALNEGETLGLLRVFDADERPSILDVAIYRQLPNDVPLLRGIITETPQTPLSHVNLRAVQNHNPNAFIREASIHPDIAPLIGKYVRYVVQPEGFEITEVTREDVEAHLESIRPNESQTPPRDLQQREIMPLELLGFESSSAVGAKAANLAQLMNESKSMGIDRGALPEMGYAVPFAFYDDFMKHNGFYEAARTMMGSSGFVEDPLVRDQALKALRKKIKNGDMPAWMLEALSEVQREFPLGHGIRCRSSTNNEDLPGFNGAGLYDSFTHHPDEGHLSKSVKQVFASLWRFLAFEHRAFYRVDHFQAAMGVLLHPNYEGELANGVAVSRHDFGVLDNHPYYANAQVGENLVTNPGISSRPEELLLSNKFQSTLNRGTTHLPVRIAASNQVPLGEVVLTDEQGVKIAGYLDRIVSHFKRLYKAGSGFAMEIEFKITRENELLIKQARPWVN